MASSKVVTTNLDLPRQSSSSFALSSILADLHHHQHNNNNDPSKTSSSMSMDDLLKFIYSSSEPDPDPDFHSPAAAAASISRQGSLSLPKEMATKTVDEVWREIVEGSDQERAGAGADLEEMTLEDFLTKAGAVREEDVRGVPAVAAINGGAQFPMPEQGMEGPSSVEAFGNGIDGSLVEVAETTGGGRGGGRRKRRVAEEPVDKATLQKQRRMIKNRESAARSRERKQAYTVELESLVSQLEEENARLLKEEADENKQRFKQLMESIIPVVEKPCGPRRKHGRVNSVEW